MLKCPKCGKSIDFLKYYEVATEDEYNASLDDNEDMKYEFVDTLTLEDSNACFTCPECGEILFRNEKDATNFLLEGE